MIKSFRIGIIRRISASIKGTESRFCYTVHIFIHIIQIFCQKSFQKIIIWDCFIRKPSLHHIFKKHFDFLICQSQFIAVSTTGYIKLTLYNFQITASKKQTPDCPLLPLQLLKNNFLVNFRLKAFPCQQIFHDHFYLSRSFSYQFSHKLIGTGICPVGS